MAKNSREDRFTWKAGYIQVEQSQCKDCLNNSGPFDCSAYGEKPDKYAVNKVKCPKRITSG